jgi:ribA/ribD-fused uncharacterized protein
MVENFNLIPGIYGFKGEYRFLSNFSLCNVTLDGIIYPTTENAYQAAKTLNVIDRLPLQICSAAHAKKIGRSLKLRSDWEQVKIQTMYDLNVQKFSNSHYKELLQKTGDLYIEETNTWKDIFWGVCNGVGSNHLGKILMKIRQEL